MWISGTGITPQEFKILTGFRPETELALKWKQTASGNYVGTDRGASEDIYRAKFKMHGHESDINALLNQIEANRAADNHVITLGSFASNEHIFGEDVDHSGQVNATVVAYGNLQQKSWKGFGIELTVQALSPTFTGSATLPTLQYLNRGYRGDSKVTVNKFDTYNGTFTYQDMTADVGIFIGTFLLPITDMRNMRRYLATQRAATISIPGLRGVDYPFGPRQTNSYPISVKVIKWEDLGMQGLNYWLLKLTLAEQIAEV